MTQNSGELISLQTISATIFRQVGTALGRDQVAALTADIAELFGVSQKPLPISSLIAGTLLGSHRGELESLHGHARAQRAYQIIESLDLFRVEFSEAEIDFTRRVLARIASLAAISPAGVR